MSTNNAALDGLALFGPPMRAGVSQLSATGVWVLG
jgi:hypothetical protein